jgi:peptidoglycan hydrolase CwlO-like protein
MSDQTQKEWIETIRELTKINVTLTARCEALEKEKRTLTERCEEQFRFIAIVESREKSERERCEALTVENESIQAERARNNEALAEVMRRDAATIEALTVENEELKGRIANALL